MYRWISFSTVCLFLCGVAAAPAAAVVLTAGDDYWLTGNGTASFEFSPAPIPAGFFFPGSDPFMGGINFGGSPIVTSPAGVLGKADTIVRRLSDTVDLSPGGIDTIPIEIVALSLTSVAPITVTTGAGSPSLWNVDVCINQPQPTGTIDLTLDTPEGGSYDSSLPVVPVFLFTPVGGGPTLSLDCGSVPGICDGMVLTNIGGPSHFTIGKDLAALGVTVPTVPFSFQTNCGATLEPSVIGSNFQNGLQSTGPGPLDNVCAPNTEAENALSANTGNHTSYLNDPNDANGNGIPDECEPSNAAPTIGTSALAALMSIMSITLVLYRRRWMRTAN